MRLLMQNVELGGYDWEDCEAFNLSMHVLAHVWQLGKPAT